MPAPISWPAGLADLGVADGDVVSVFLPNCLEFLEAWWAILKAGGGARARQPGVRRAARRRT